MGMQVRTAAIIEVLDSAGKVSGYELENHYTYEPDMPDDPGVKMFTPKVVRDPATEERVAAIRGISAAGLTDESAALRALNATLQEEKAAASQACAKAIAIVNTLKNEAALFLEELTS